MNIEDRIERRLQLTGDTGVVSDVAAISPTTHLEAPIGQSAVLEQLLDVLDPSFHGSTVPDIYVWGPKGAGKSAVVTALFYRLANYSQRGSGMIHTTTRVSAPRLPEYVYVDTRTATTRFGLYHAVLAALTDESVPRQGVETEALERRLIDAVTDVDNGVVVAVDHANEPETHMPSEIAELFTSIGAVSVLVIGRASSNNIDWTPGKTVRVDAYRRHELIDIVTDRVTNGLEHGAITHEQVRRVAAWADGDVHDALAAVLGAAVLADSAGDESTCPATLDSGIDAVPKPSTALGRVLALPSNRKRVLRELIELSADERESVNDVTTAIAATDRIDLSESTVQRILYELAEVDIVSRKPVDTPGKGRPPSRIDPTFPTLVFRELYDRRVATTDQ